MLIDRTESPWPYSIRYIDEMSEQETGRLSKTLGARPAERFANMIVLNNLNLDIKLMQMQGSEITKEHGKIRELYREEKQNFSAARYSLKELLGEDVYHNAPTFAQRDILKLLHYPTKKRPIGLLRDDELKFADLKKLLGKRAIAKVDNGDGFEIALLSTHNDYQETVEAVYPSLGRKSFKILRIDESSCRNRSDTLCFAKALNMMLLVRNQVRSGLVGSSMSFLGFRDCRKIPDAALFPYNDQLRHNVSFGRMMRGMKEPLKRGGEPHFEKLKIDRDKWPFRESRGFGTHASIDELTNEELKRFPDHGQAKEMKAFVELYNGYNLAGYLDWLHCPKREKEERAQKMYTKEKKKYAEIVYSLPALIGEGIFESLRVVTEQTFRERVYDDPKRTPLGMLRYLRVEELKTLFSVETPIVRVDNGDGNEIVLISVHYWTDCESVFVAHKSLKKKKLDLWRMDRSAPLWISDTQYKEPLWFGQALNIKLLAQNGMRSGIIERDQMVYLGFSGKKPPTSDEEDRQSG